MNLPRILLKALAMYQKSMKALLYPQKCSIWHSCSPSITSRSPEHCLIHYKPICGNCTKRWCYSFFSCVEIGKRMWWMFLLINFYMKKSVYMRFREKIGQTIWPPPTRLVQGMEYLATVLASCLTVYVLYLVGGQRLQEVNNFGQKYREHGRR